MYILWETFLGIFSLCLLILSFITAVKLKVFSISFIFNEFNLLMIIGENMLVKYVLLEEKLRVYSLAQDKQVL